MHNILVMYDFMVTDMMMLNLNTNDCNVASRYYSKYLGIQSCLNI